MAKKNGLIRRYLKFSVLFILVYTLVLSCAEPSMPSGGPKDTKPPSIHQKKYSTPPLSTNFNYNQVILTFDEWIQLKNAQEQLIISPPLQDKPKIQIKNKSLVLSWDESLKDSTTYTIHFGDAVADITESNPVKNLKFVFSTGNQIDSLYCSGKIVSSASSEPLSDVLVMLYQEYDDSLPYLKKPYYFSKTDASGQFSIEHIKSDNYKVFALADINKNYLYDLPNEKIGFLDSFLQVAPYQSSELRLSLFEEKQPAFYLDMDQIDPFYTELNFKNILHDSFKISPLNKKSTFIYHEYINNKVRIWHDSIAVDKNDSLILEINNTAENIKDTIYFRSNKKINPASFSWKAKKALKDSWIDTFSQKNIINDVLSFNTSDQLELIFSQPLDSINKSLFELLEDSTYFIYEDSIVYDQDSMVIDTIPLKKSITQPVNKKSFELISDVVQKRKLVLKSNWLPEKNYQLNIFPGALKSVFGSINDSLSAKYTLKDSSTFGRIGFNIDSMEINTSYIIQLINDKELICKELIMDEPSSDSTFWNEIPVGVYRIKAILDRNRDGIWNTGNYLLKKQAEKILWSETIDLKAGWEHFSTLKDDYSN